jgi:hypothetical protein
MIDFDDVLDSIMTEEPSPSYEALLRWSARYPQFTQDLTEFFAQWAIQSERSEETEIDTARLSNLAVSHALDILHRRGKRQQVAARLFNAIASVGITVQNFAAELGLDEMLLKKLDLRRLTEVPEQFCRSVGNRLGISAEAVRSIVAGSPLANAATHYKSKGKPLPATEKFIHAVQNSSLSADQKAYWIKVVEDEKQN